MATTSKKGRKFGHRFLEQRGIKAGYIGMRIDSYKQEANEHGGFTPLCYGEQIRGNLWPSEQKATDAVKYVLGQKQGTVGILYGVFKLVAIVEQDALPITTAKV